MAEKNEVFLFLFWRSNHLLLSPFSQQMTPSRYTEGDGNHTSVAMFVLLGLSDDKELQLILFPVFLGIYLVTLTWNLGLIILIRLDFHLQTPMYFFLSFLSFIDVCFSSSIVPRMLADFLKDEETISLLACASQYLVVAWMAVAECCLLAAMAYDRYVAIGSPLQYSATWPMSEDGGWGLWQWFPQQLSSNPPFAFTSTTVGQILFDISSVTFLRL